MTERYYIETMNFAGDWCPAIWTTKPTVKDGCLVRTNSTGPRARRVTRIPEDLHECGPEELQAMYVDKEGEAG